MHGSSTAPTHEVYIAALDEPRRSEIRTLHELIRRAAPQLEPTMAFGILGYGTYHYRYGKTCIRVRRAADLDPDVLVELLREAAAHPPGDLR